MVKPRGREGGGGGATAGFPSFLAIEAQRIRPVELQIFISSSSSFSALVVSQIVDLRPRGMTRRMFQGTMVPQARAHHRLLPDVPGFICPLCPPFPQGGGVPFGRFGESCPRRPRTRCCSSGRTVSRPLSTTPQACRSGGGIHPSDDG